MRSLNATLARRGLHHRCGTESISVTCSSIRITVGGPMTQASESAVRSIDTGALPERYARGWHCLGLLDQFRDGRPHAIQAFGTKLVVFPAADGSLRVLDAYCRHMGGDLTQGTVKDGNIACPFHAWRWSPEGRCVGIPYAKRVPLRARTRAWTTQVLFGLLLVWFVFVGTPPPPVVVFF